MRKPLGILMMVGLLAGLARGGDAPAGGARPTSEFPKVQFWIGVAVENIPPAMARQLKLKKDQGLLVVSVLPGSPAQVANLQPEDLLVEVNGVPLTTQEQLSRIANGVLPGAQGELQAKAAKLTLLRDGDRQVVEVLPALRPAGLQVMGGNLGNFTANAGEPAANGAAQMRTYALPNGATVQVGSGYQFNLNSPDATSKSIRSVMNKGQSIVLSQETDATGKVRNSLVVGPVTYDVTREKIKDIPEDVRPLAEQLLKTPPQQVAVRPPSKTMEDRIQDLEKSNHVLQQDNKDLKERIDSLLKVLEHKK